MKKGPHPIEMVMNGRDGQQIWHGQGNGPLDAAWHAVVAQGIDTVHASAHLRDYSEHAVGQGNPIRRPWPGLNWAKKASRGGVYGAGVR